jgi:hypothetical protein
MIDNSFLGVGRKFVFAVLVVVLSFALVIFGKLNADAFTNFSAIIGGIYVVGNVSATVANKITTPPVV